MFKNIFKICVIFAIATAVVSGHKTQIATSILDGFHDDLKIKPYVKVGNKFYYFGQNKVNWYKAFLICRSMGGFLASFENKEELTELSNYMIDKYPKTRWFWISGSDLNSEGDFYWYRTGERITCADWSGNQPDNAGGNENCVHLWYKHPKYQMNDWICNKPAHYICEADKPITVVLSIF